MVYTLVGGRWAFLWKAGTPRAVKSLACLTKVVGVAVSGMESYSCSEKECTSLATTMTMTMTMSVTVHSSQFTVHSVQWLASATKHDRWTDHLQTRCGPSADPGLAAGGAKHLLLARLGLHLVYTWSTLGIHLVYTSFPSILHICPSVTVIVTVSLVWKITNTTETHKQCYEKSCIHREIMTCMKQLKKTTIKHENMNDDKNDV